MVYMGSKNRIAKEILPIILKGIKQDQYYIEPFAGGFNCIDKVDKILGYHHKNKIASDCNKYLIALFKHLQVGGKLPKYITKDAYLKIKDNKSNYKDWLVGYAGFICSFRGIFFSGYIDNNIYEKSTKRFRIYQAEKRNNILKQTPSLKDIDIYNSDYKNLHFPDNSIIYCDIPYQNTAKYKEGDFNHNEFWDWCRKMKKQGHTIFISEYNAPSDFKCVWQKDINNNLGSTSKTATEKLFTI